MSYQPKTDLYRERNFSDLFNDTMVFVFRNMFSIAKKVFVFVGPMAILYFITMGIVMYGAMSSFSAAFSPQNAADQGLFQYLISGGMLLSITTAFFMGLFFYLTLNSFILRFGESTDGKVTFGEIWEDIKEHFVHFLGIGAIRMVVYMVLGFVMIGFGTASDSILLTIVMGIIILYLGVSTSLADVIRMNEGGSVMHALKYSFQLVHKKWFSTFGLYLVLAIVNVLVLLLVSVFSGLFSAIFVDMFGSNIYSTILTSLLMFVILMTFYTSFLSMFWMAGTLTYFSLSGTEGRGSSAEYLIEEIGKTHEDSLF